MNQQTFEQHLVAELQKFGCEVHITAGDILREFCKLELREQAASLDSEDLALLILDCLNEASFMELAHSAVRTAVTDMLTRQFGVDHGNIPQEALHG